MSRESRLQEYLQGLEPEEVPKQVSRIRQRKKESDAKWKARAIQYLQKEEKKRENKEEKYGEASTREAILAVEDALARGDIESTIQKYQDIHAWAPLIPTYVGPHIPFPADGPKSSDIRGEMAIWIEQTKLSKEAEANCDLDCLNCPTERMLLCALQNRTVRKADGLNLEEKK